MKQAPRLRVLKTVGQFELTDSIRLDTRNRDDARLSKLLVTHDGESYYWNIAVPVMHPPDP